MSGTLGCTFYLITTPYFPSVSNSVCPLNMFAFKRLKRQRGTLLLSSILSILPLLWLVPSFTHTQATHTHSQPISGLDHRSQAHLITEVKQVMWNEWGEADRYSGNTRGSRKAAADWKEDVCLKAARFNWKQQPQHRVGHSKRVCDSPCRPLFCNSQPRLYLLASLS